MNRRSMSDDKEYQIQRLSSALEVSNNTIKNLEKRLKDALQVIAIFEQEKRMWGEQKKLQERIIRQQLESSDVEKRMLEKEVIDLREKLKAA